MIKKHIITCTIIFCAAIVSELFIFSVPVVADRVVDKEVINDRILERHQEEKQRYQKEQFFASLNFADEYIPFEEKKVKRCLERSIRSMSFKSIRTHKLHKKAYEWFAVIEPILAAYGIPEDFKYVPLIESGFRSGTSARGASGYWQFMPATARAFGLKVNNQVDERQNLKKSTIAAAKYLKALYREFGSWTLAAAAYNVGEGSLRRSINRQGQDNYFKLELNAETGIYVYRLISVKEIIEHPSKYGFNPSVGGQLLADMGNDESSNRL